MHPPLPDIFYKSRCNTFISQDKNQVLTSFCKTFINSPDNRTWTLFLFITHPQSNYPLLILRLISFNHFTFVSFFKITMFRGDLSVWLKFVLTKVFLIVPPKCTHHFLPVPLCPSFTCNESGLDWEHWKSVPGCLICASLLSKSTLEPSKQKPPSWHWKNNICSRVHDTSKVTRSTPLWISKLCVHVQLAAHAWGGGGVESGGWHLAGWTDSAGLQLW